MTVYWNRIQSGFGVLTSRYRPLLRRICSSQRLNADYPVPCDLWGYWKLISSSAFPWRQPLKSLTVNGRRELQTNKQISITGDFFVSSPWLLLAANLFCVRLLCQPKVKQTEPELRKAIRSWTSRNPIRRGTGPAVSLSVGVVCGQGGAELLFALLLGDSTVISETKGSVWIA